MIVHSFAAGIRTVCEMWVRPELLSSWLGPAGADMFFVKTDVRKEGVSQWSMIAADGQTKHGKLNDKIISPNRFLIYTQNFCDRAGNLSKPPFSSTCPDMLLTTVTFAGGRGENTDHRQVENPW